MTVTLITHKHLREEARQEPPPVHTGEVTKDLVTSPV
jgi:chlorophyllide a reductase subunit X